MYCIGAAFEASRAVYDAGSLVARDPELEVST